MKPLARMYLLGPPLSLVIPVLWPLLRSLGGTRPRPVFTGGDNLSEAYRS